MSDTKQVWRLNLHIAHDVFLLHGGYLHMHTDTICSKYPREVQTTHTQNIGSTGSEAVGPRGWGLGVAPAI